jgi:hypothetical protein
MKTISKKVRFVLKKYYVRCVYRLVHITRHFADPFPKNFFSSWIDLNELLDAVFNADYEFNIYIVQKFDFDIEN